MAFLYSSQSLFRFQRTHNFIYAKTFAYRGTASAVPLLVILFIYFPYPSLFSPLLPIRGLRRQRPLRLSLLQLRNLRFHLHDQHLQLLLALLAGVGVDIPCVLFAVGPFGGIASLEEMVVDLADTAGTGSALAAHVGLEIGHTRLFRLGWGSFLPRL